MNDNFDTRSVISEPPISRSVVYRETVGDAPGTVIRKYKTTKTTTTTHHAPNGYVYTTQQHQVNGVPVLKPINIQQQEHSQEQAKTRNLRSSSIPASTRRNFINSEQNISGPEASRYYTSRTTSNRSQYNSNSTKQQQQQQQQFVAPMSPSISVRAASTPRMVNGNDETYYRHMNNQQYFKTCRDSLSQQQKQQQQQQHYHNQQNAFNTSSSHTLPVNYRQTHNDTLNNTTFAYSPTSSCIDYSNTHCNSDWAMRHGYFKSVNP